MSVLPSRVPSGHETKSSILYLDSPTVRPKDIVRLSRDPLIQDSLNNDRLVLLLWLSSWLIHVPLTMRLCNSQIPEEHLVCYQTSQHNWVVIKVLYRCFRWYLLSWHRSRLGFVTPIVGEYLWALSVMHITISLASNVTNELVAGWCITERVKRLAGNEIELGMKIPDTSPTYL